ncbi:helix-turn-helix transcriptional regulator [Streptomyces sp. HYC2]|uniref:helix-turn-helix domain-containing protein n=1 Tax=Streptomyces sp. HYC2 TaxID=2955207 RepID=UPI002480AD31|nr:helix-turn-helix transcriptional regulator [Streptomyces sp. HYC2]
MNQPGQGRRQLAARMGPTAATVAANLRRIRKARGLTVYTLSDKVEEAGRTIHPAAISKIERQERQTTVDNLMALAAALNVTPSALLLPPDDDPGQTIAITGAGPVPADLAWDWVDGARPLTVPDGDQGTAKLDHLLHSRPPGRRTSTEG